MIPALLLASLAGSDLVGWGVTRISRGRASLRTLAIAIGAWAVLIGAAGLLIAGPWTLLAVPMALAWPVAVQRWATSSVVFLAVIAAFVLIRLQPGMRIGDAAEAAYTVQVCTAVAVIAFLGVSANLLCRGALARGRGMPSGAFRSALRTRWHAPEPATQQLRGGRLIGPLERWIIVALGLAGMQAVIAALMAAKGIVRFPEISRDAGAGARAEEFLVGSLISWALAGAGAALIWAA